MIDIQYIIGYFLMEKQRLFWSLICMREKISLLEIKWDIFKHDVIFSVTWSIRARWPGDTELSLEFWKQEFRKQFWQVIDKITNAKTVWLLKLLHKDALRIYR